MEADTEKTEDTDMEMMIMARMTMEMARYRFADMSYGTPIST